MDSFQLVIWDDHEKEEKGLPDCKQVVVGWFPFKGGEGVCVCVSWSPVKGVQVVRHAIPIANSCPR